MDIDQPLPLLADMTPRQFMKRHWQKKPLFVRAAIAGFRAPVGRTRLFELAAREDAESRLIRRSEAGWQLEHGPFPRRALPALKTPNWTLLVQGIDLLDDAAHELLQRFRFVPDARLDDLMISWASDGGGVGPHFDRYDVFLLQAQGRRRWRIGQQSDLTLDLRSPLKILADFRPQQEFVLEPGGLLYLPPGWAHEGTALGSDCLTYSIGFRAPAAAEVARELLLRLADAQGAGAALERLYTDSGQPATASPAEIPDRLTAFGRRALETLLGDSQALARAFGESLSEPAPSVWFDSGDALLPQGTVGAVRIDRRTRMLYDERHVFVNGESHRMSRRDAPLWKRLANARYLSAAEVAAGSVSMRQRLAGWAAAGWLCRETR